jgi:hypothetical protein
MARRVVLFLIADPDVTDDGVGPVASFGDCVDVLGPIERRRRFAALVVRMAWRKRRFARRIVVAGS